MCSVAACQSLQRHVCRYLRSGEMRAYKFGQKWEIGQKSPALTGLRKTDAANSIKPLNSSRNQRFQEVLEPITANARGGVIRGSRRTRVFSRPWLRPKSHALEVPCREKCICRHKTKFPISRAGNTQAQK